MSADIDYDIIIIGAGPAGLTAGLYAARAGMKVLVLEKTAAGGQLCLTEVIENFPGFPRGIKGLELAEQMKAQAEQAGLEVRLEQATEIAWLESAPTARRCRVKTEAGDYSAYAIIIASGAHPRRLGVPGEEALTGQGVSYCATCDGPLFRNRDLVVVGGGNAAAEEALFLSRFARQVTLVHRRDRLRADKVLQERLKADPKIDFAWSCRMLEISGKAKVEAVRLEDVTTGEQKVISCAGVFIFAGFTPNTDFLKGLVKTDGQGFIVTDEKLATSRPSIFACGDCRRRHLRQVVTACSEGARAAQSCRNYVEQMKGQAYV